MVPSSSPDRLKAAQVLGAVLQRLWAVRQRLGSQLCVVVLVHKGLQAALRQAAVCGRIKLGCTVVHRQRVCQLEAVQRAPQAEHSATGCNIADSLAGPVSIHSSWTCKHP